MFTFSTKSVAEENFFFKIGYVIATFIQKCRCIQFKIFRIAAIKAFKGIQSRHPKTFFFYTFTCNKKFSLKSVIGFGVQPLSSNKSIVVLYSLQWPTCIESFKYLSYWIFFSVPNHDFVAERKTRVCFIFAFKKIIIGRIEGKTFQLFCKNYRKTFSV